MRVILDLDDAFSKVLSFTAISIGKTRNITSFIANLSQGNYIKIDETGKAHQYKDEADANELSKEYMETIDREVEKFAEKMKRYKQQYKAESYHA